VGQSPPLTANYYKNQQMWHRARQVGSRLVKWQRKFSTELNTEEKTAAIAKELKKSKWLHRYGVIVFPSTFLVLLTTVVVNSKYSKEVVEEYFPSYIDFVREYYGFDEEDREELNYVKHALQAQQSPVNVLVTLDNREKIQVADINGSMSYGSLEQQLIGKYGKSIHDISFEDSPSTTTPILPISPSAEYNESIKSTIATLNLVPSMWDHHAYKELNLSKNEIDMSNITNFAGSFMYGIHIYLKIKATYTLGVLHKYTQVSSKVNQNLKKNLELDEAKARKQYYENLIKELNIKLRTSSAEMSVDDIHEGIRDAKENITKLNRRYFNWFYYF
jgi:hypothetical protein